MPSPPMTRASKRAEAEQGLREMEQELKAKLLEIRG